jgi:hypothetical protein
MQTPCLPFSVQKTGPTSVIPTKVDQILDSIYGTTTAER